MTGQVVTVKNVDLKLLRKQYKTLLDVRAQEVPLNELNVDAIENFEGLLNLLEAIFEENERPS